MPLKSIENCSPYFKLYKESPDLSILRAFGCLCYVSTSKLHRTKFDIRANPGVFLGYPSNTKGYKVLDLHTQQIVISWDVIFYETHFPYLFQSNSHSGDFPSTIYLPMVTTDSSLYNDDTDVLHDAHTQFVESVDNTVDFSPLLNSDHDESTDHSSNFTNNSFSPDSVLSDPVIGPCQPARQSNRLHKPPTYLKDFVCNYVRTISHWCNVVPYSILPTPHKCFMSKVCDIHEPATYHEASLNPLWIEAMAKEIDALNSNNTWDFVDLPPGKKAIGSKWVFKVKLKSDGSLERCKAHLVAKGYNQRFGIDYEETFSPFVKMATIRCLLALAASKKWFVHQLDVNNAFLHGDLSEEVYICVPAGISNPLNEVCRLRKSIYGLKQASRIEVGYLPDGIFLSQKTFTHELLDSCDFDFSRKASTPLPINLKLNASDGDLLPSPESYRSLVGKLNFLTNTRPDLAYAVQSLSQFMQQPRSSHLSALLHTLCYVSHTMGQGILLRADDQIKLQAFSDLDWAACVDSRKSVTGQSAIHIAKNPVFHEITKHIEINCHFTRDKVLEGLIQLTYLPTKSQIADLFTKTLPPAQFSYLLSKLGFHLPPASGPPNLRGVLVTNISDPFKIMFSELGGAKILALDLVTLQALSEFSDILVHLHSPFPNLKYLKLPYGCKESYLSSSVRQYLLGGSPHATIVQTLSQEDVISQVAPAAARAINDQASSSWRLDHEVNSEFVGMLDLVKKRYPETFEQVPIENKKILTVKLNLCCSSVNAFMKTCMTEIDTKLLAEYRALFTDLQRWGYNINWLMSRLNYTGHLHLSNPLLSELQAIDSGNDNTESKLKDLQTLHAEMMTDPESFQTTSTSLAATACYIGDGLL
ncbi:hypothetical protein AgCh_027995 [Apium graveolens]